MTFRINAAFFCAFVSLWLTGCSGTPARAPSTGSDLEKTHLTIGLAVPGLRFLYDYAWFVGFFVALVSYYLLMLRYRVGVSTGSGPVTHPAANE